MAGKLFRIKNFIFAIAVLSAVSLVAPAPVVNASVNNTDASETANVNMGGGYAITGQITQEGYTAQIYDASNGLITSDANYILGASDGYVWIGGYSGIMRYDGAD